jgi:serine protease Do
MAKVDFRQIVQGAKGKVFPAVVFIKCLRESHESGRKITQEVFGSGVLISPDGEMLSNWHVVDKAVEVRCLLYDGTNYTAEVIGTDKDTDLALLRLKLPEERTEPLPFAELGESSGLKEGDFVMAMGAPWGLSRSVSIGIISCTRRFLRNSSEYSLWLQTDASISPGNSGGPLVNTAGQIVGINTRGGTSGGDMGFAIPADVIRFLVPQLREHGQVNWSWTGLQIQPLKDFQRDVYFEGDRGVIVSETDHESPARRAGIRSRDRLLRINDLEVNVITEEDLPAARRALGSLPKNEPVQLTLMRDGKEIVVPMTPRAKGKVEGEELECSRWNMTVKTINQFDNESLYNIRKEGVFLYGVRHPGNAADAGLRPEDIIVQIGQKKITTLEDVKAAYDEAIANVATEHRVQVVVLRNGLMMYRVLDFSRNYEKE